MCGGVLYNYKNKAIKTFFPNPKAKLPILQKTGGVILLTWGRRKNEIGDLPIGGWARLESIKTGKWDKYHPKPVKIPLTQFMEKDLEGTSHWFELVTGQVLQGLLATHNQEQRVYVVTIVPQHEKAIHDRWPKIICC
jgi:hypothetical protein